MKKTFLFCTRLRFYLTEIPPVALLIIAIAQNSNADGFFKLYPLIAVLSLGIIMIFLYFFRLIFISNEEIESVGIFSSRDHAIIDSGKTLTTIIKSDGQIKVELSEKCANSSFSWNKDNDSPLSDINIYRERAVGGKRAVKRILKYFSVPQDDYLSILNDEKFEKAYENFNIKAFDENKERYINIEFTKTI